MVLAREKVEIWKPITNKNCSPYHATWVPNGQSFSCSYCGSMSTEEIIECLYSVPAVDFEMADSASKVYIGRYRHAGNCSDLCHCDGRSGGPIKFKSWHLFDGERQFEEANGIWFRIRVECQRTQRELFDRMKKTHENYN